MRVRNHHSPVYICVCLFIMVGFTGCQAPPPPGPAPDDLPSPAYLDGQEKANLYLQQRLADYDVVAVLYELNTTERQQFLDRSPAFFFHSRMAKPLT